MEDMQQLNDISKYIQQFNDILISFNIKANCVNYQSVDNYFYYDIKLLSKSKVKDITKYSDEISLRLKTLCKPSVKIIHNKGVVRLEFISPRKNRLNLFDYFTNEKVPSGDLICLLGQAVDGSRVWMDLANNPHMIISGTTGSGKSVLLHNIIGNLLNYSKPIIHLMDPKNIEFSDYEKIKHNVNVSYTYDECNFVLGSLLGLMEQRYKMLRSGMPATSFPPVVIIIDEFADLIMQDKENQFLFNLLKLSQKCRAAKIYIILATQRPSVNIIDGSIKANFPARISCRVASHVDSKVIIDSSGAENLLGNGDALLKDNSRFMERFQVAYTSAKEICNYFK